MSLECCNDPKKGIESHTHADIERGGEEEWIVEIQIFQLINSSMRQNGMWSGCRDVVKNRSIY